ncbi:Swd3p SCDLUD_002057 [Saccharomycodes ludwigii]|uniref:Swd3p n=1 Tax=Saccharomycodes ludwigii TaxID=36035 RepID=UPI001E890197|nr:hypothetical protein SCDLUD_002057 [Saccharomycodes ludwigii]KAH3902240.1 hypothetical protein SCDLUD_002057 [Saccharomycodes ludwigii]
MALKQILTLQLLPKSHSYTSLSISPNGKYLALTTALQSITIYRISNNTNITSLIPHSKLYTDHLEGINKIIWSPDSQCIASASDDCTIEITHIKYGKLQTLIGHTAPVITIKYSYKGNLLFSGSMDESIKIWNVSASGIYSGSTFTNSSSLLTAPMKTISAHSDPVVVLDMPSKDSSILASGSFDGLIRIFDTQTGNCLKTLTYDKDWAKEGGLPIINLQFSYNGKYLLVKSMDGVLKLWDYVSGQVLRTFTCTASPDSSNDIDMTKNAAKVVSNESSLNGKHCTGISFLYETNNNNKVIIIDGDDFGDLKSWDVQTQTLLDNIKSANRSYDNCIIDLACHKNMVFSLSLNGLLSVWKWL